VSEKLGSQASVFKPSYAHIIINKSFRITEKTEKDNPRQLHLIAPFIAAIRGTTKGFTSVRHHRTAESGQCTTNV
jgi:hypothetical protein